MKVQEGIRDLKPVAESSDTAESIFKDLADRERHSFYLDLNRYATGLVDKGLTANMDDVVNTFKMLEDKGYGKVVVGRGDKPSTFIPNKHLKWIGAMALSDMQAIKQLEKEHVPMEKHPSESTRHILTTTVPLKNESVSLLTDLINKALMVLASITGEGQEVPTPVEKKDGRKQSWTPDRKAKHSKILKAAKNKSKQGRKSKKGDKRSTEWTKDRHKAWYLKRHGQEKYNMKYGASPTTENVASMPTSIQEDAVQQVAKLIKS